MISEDSLYAAYVKERQGLLCLWESYGFIAYKIVEHECFLSDMFIRKEDRKSGKCRELLGSLEEIAKRAECKIITANIHLWDVNANKTLAAAQACGFEVKGANNGVILIVKELKGA